jgi:hypothetical protein
MKAKNQHALFISHHELSLIVKNLLLVGNLPKRTEYLFKKCCIWCNFVTEIKNIKIFCSNMKTHSFTKQSLLAGLLAFGVTIAILLLVFSSGFLPETYKATIFSWQTLAAVVAVHLLPVAGYSGWRLAARFISVHRRARLTLVADAKTTKFNQK